MIGQATAHRRANAFAKALEGSGERETHAADRRADPAQERLLAMASALADVPKPDLAPEVKTVQRAQLIAAMEAAIADGTLDTSGRVPEQRKGPGAHRAVGLRRLRPRSRWSRRLAAGGLTVGVAAGAFGGVAAASTNALPGDTLYGLKRGMEDLRLGMANDDAGRGRVLLDMASTRMQEARRLMERGRSGPLDADSVREVGRALVGMHKEAAEGHRLLSGAYQRNGSLTSIEALNDFSRTNGSTWGQLRRQLPPQLHEVGAQVTSVFDAIEREVAPLQSLLPPAPGSGSRHHHSDTGSGEGGSFSNGTGHPSSGSGAGSHSGASGHGKNTAPSPTDGTGGAGQGLIGGSGLLNNPAPSVSPSSSSGKSSSGQPSQPGVTIPPLLPGILPGIGITGGDSSK
ncbi:DUF5667 domain-containing protein [Streptomyces sp. RB6PN25]|uniref:DUF5667 domain-containing protein n=1 Tax=Streptomyces humicola TaxID=2953240 RepID=A0ABT1PU28_9ACTN|nr:DUF5667 domain-containing protein [Streptomyces humicola]MCQ4081195.1 DUF5667 domain-containing protein [Streptomyces humicola]